MVIFEGKSEAKTTKLRPALEALISPFWIFLKTEIRLIPISLATPLVDKNFLRIKWKLVFPLPSQNSIIHPI